MTRAGNTRNREAGIGGFLFAGLFWLFTEVLHWNGWISAAVAMGCAFTGGIICLAVRDTWPQTVPPELAGAYLTYERAGWRLAKIHPWWRCDDSDSRPHVHLVSRDGTRRILAVPRGAGG